MKTLIVYYSLEGNTEYAAENSDRYRRPGSGAGTDRSENKGKRGE